MKIELPGKPISVNKLYRGRRFLTKEGEAIKYAMAVEAKRQYKGKPLECDISVDIDVYFTNERSDLDNALKGLFDALTGIIWKDDKQIITISARKLIDKKQPRVELTIDYEV